MNCPTCRTAVQPGTHFCIACGANLSAARQPEMPQAPAPSAAQQAAAYQTSAPIEPVTGQSTTMIVVPAPKTKSTALAIEAVAAIFGIFGVGWLYSGNTAIGILLLIAGFCWDFVVLFVLALTVGFGAFCILPIHMLLVLGSVLLLNVAAPKTL